jgi:hypothetical protein
MMVRRSATAIALACAALIAGACGPHGPRCAMTAYADSLSFCITPDPLPPIYREPIAFKVVIKNRRTGKAIEGGEGRIFATSAEGGTNVYDGFVEGPELGTYYAKLRFVTAGDWSMGLQFRTDSTQPLMRPPDWRQNVRASGSPY